MQDHPEISTKTFLPFCFRIICLKDAANVIIWENPVPNSPFAVRPLSLFAVPENENNVRFLMESINFKTEYLQKNGFQLPPGSVKSSIKKAQLKDKHLIQHGFPINRSTQLAREIFLEVDEDEFLARPPSARFNITHKPI